MYYSPFNANTAATPSFVASLSGNCAPESNLCHLGSSKKLYANKAGCSGMKCAGIAVKWSSCDYNVEVVFSILAERTFSEWAPQRWCY